MKYTKGAALAMAVYMAIIPPALTGCALLPWENPEESAEAEIEDELPGEQEETWRGNLFVNTLEIPAGPQWAIELPELKKLADQKYNANSDTIGWLRVPNTSVDDVVVFYPDDANDYYLRRDFEGRSNNYGTYFADFRSTFGESFRWQDLATNTTIYGHSMEDNPNGLAFSQLKKYLDEEFALENPNIYFSTLGGDMVWEVFAVFYGTTELSYNVPEFPDFDEIMGEILARSIYNYDTVVTKEDKFLTLSTCCYNYDPKYPNKYRYVIMAKLLHPGEEIKETAVFGINPNPKAP